MALLPSVSRLPLVITLLGLPVLLGACVLPVHTKGWHELRDGSLVLRSCGDPDQSLALAAELREVRARLSRHLPEVPARDEIPFAIHVFCEGHDYVTLAPDPAQGNHYVLAIRSTRVDASYESTRVAAASHASGTQLGVRAGHLRVATDLVRHHYVHHLIRTHADVPLWIDEGLAGFLGTLHWEASGQVRQGAASHGMHELRDLGLQVPLDRILRATDLATWPVQEQIWFYHGSWLVMHYLHFGKPSRDAEPGPALVRFSQLYPGQLDEREAALQAFGESTIAMRNAIDRYQRTHSVRLSKGRAAPPAYPDASDGLGVRALPEGEAAYGLGRLALDNRDGVTAQALFERAYAGGIGARAQAGLARALALQRRWSDAFALLEAAEASAGDAPVVLLDGARLFLARAQSTAVQDGDLGRARSRAERVLENSPQLAEAHALVARSLRGHDAPNARLAALERAHELFPAAIDVAFELARARAAVGQVEAARTLAERVGGWVLGELRDDEVQDFLDDLPDEQEVAAVAR